MERAIRNVAAFCDRIFAVDHVSTDGTWDILRELSTELDHLDVRRARHTRDSHRVLEPFIGTETWAFRVDGDEVYDPVGLAAFREPLDAGEFDRAFRVQANVLHCDSLDLEERVATGYLSPPSRPVTALFNLNAADSWKAGAERLEGGEIRFRDGYDWQSIRPLHERYAWEESPLRYLHLCFLRRSSLDPETPDEPRLTLSESGEHRRGVVGMLTRAVRRPHVSPQIEVVRERGSSWKLEKYRRGPLVETDVAPFFGE